jgi:hypothetical protein
VTLYRTSGMGKGCGRSGGDRDAAGIGDEFGGEDTFRQFAARVMGIRYQVTVRQWNVAEMDTPTNNVVYKCKSHTKTHI